MSRLDPTSIASLPHLLGARALRLPNRVAATFLDDDQNEESWTYGQLWDRACDLARRLPSTAQESPRALLLFPPGIEFLAGFLGCQIAGWTPVPTCYPRTGRPLPLPFFHDMGLIGGLLAPLYVGARTVVISPRTFLQRPIRWLQCISDYGATISGAPNFAFQLCVDRVPPDQCDHLDLSRWRVAFCGAEPIVARTLRDFAHRFSVNGFKASAYYPCYGLAEASLLAAVSDGPGEPTVVSVDRDELGRGKAHILRDDRGISGQPLVSCGPPAHQTELMIVDPTSHQAVDERMIGEIWLRGPSITDGYWNRQQENDAQFRARLANGDAGFHRSGDLGFLHDGNLYVTGRRIDLIVLRGRNLFPQDIEATVRQAIGDQGGQCVAIAAEGVRGEVLAIIAELPRRTDSSPYPELVRAIRRCVIETHEVDPTQILLVRQNRIPLTSSGKVQRNHCRQLMINNELKPQHHYVRSSAGEQTPIALPSVSKFLSEGQRQPAVDAIEAWMTDWLLVRAGVVPSEIAGDKPFSAYGLDSMTAVEMSGEIEDWSGVVLTPAIAQDYPSISRLSEFVVDKMIEVTKTRSTA